jgi:hypothetical protein
MVQKGSLLDEVSAAPGLKWRAVTKILRRDYWQKSAINGFFIPTCQLLVAFTVFLANTGPIPTSNHALLFIQQWHPAMAETKNKTQNHNTVHPVMASTNGTSTF